MSSTPRVGSAIEGRPATFKSALAHCPELAAAFQDLYGTLWRHGVVDQAIKETARMRNARVTDCGFCKNVRFDGALASGLTEAMVQQIDDGYQDSSLSHEQKLVLRFTDAYLKDPSHLPAEIAAQMSVCFTPPQIVELTLALTMFLGMAKVLISLGMEPEEMTTTVLPTPAVAGAAAGAGAGAAAGTA